MCPYSKFKGVLYIRLSLVTAQTPSANQTFQGYSYEFLKSFTRLTDQLFAGVESFCHLEYLQDLGNMTES